MSNAREKIRDVVYRYIVNTTVYDNNTLELQDDKDNELWELVSIDYYDTIANLRPYVGVVDKVEMVAHKIDIKTVEQLRSTVDIDISSRRHFLDGDNTVAITSSTLELTNENDNWVITSIDEDITPIDRDDNFNQIMYDDMTIDQEFVRYLLINKPNMSNLKYMYRGTPKVNPLKDVSKDYNIDMFNVVYWVFKEIELDNELDYPLTQNELINYERLQQVFDKGHKYKSNLTNLIKGDILFFDTNDSLIGVYVGENKFITLTGKFPKDNTTLSIHDIDDYWWERFNGRVMRLRGDL
ncbi:tail protein [Staphylococcus phage PG-2021_40]